MQKNLQCQDKGNLESKRNSVLATPFQIQRVVLSNAIIYFCIFTKRMLGAVKSKTQFGKRYQSCSEALSMTLPGHFWFWCILEFITGTMIDYFPIVLILFDIFARYQYFGNFS